MKLEIDVPESYTGDIMSDLNTKRAHVLGMNPDDNGTTTIEAMAPLAEVQRYATDLRSITQGRGAFSMDFDHYQKVPPHRRRRRHRRREEGQGERQLAERQRRIKQQGQPLRLACFVLARVGTSVGGDGYRRRGGGGLIRTGTGASVGRPTGLSNSPTSRPTRAIASTNVRIWFSLSPDEPA